MSESKSEAVLAPQGTAPASLNHIDEVVTPSKAVTPNAQIMETPVIGRIPLPYVLPLHSMCDSLKTALSEGQVLTSGQRSELLELNCWKQFTLMSSNTQCKYIAFSTKNRNKAMTSVWCNTCGVSVMTTRPPSAISRRR